MKRPDACECTVINDFRNCRLFAAATCLVSETSAAPNPSLFFNSYIRVPCLPKRSVRVRKGFYSILATQIVSVSTFETLGFTRSSRVSTKKPF